MRRLVGFVELLAIEIVRQSAPAGEGIERQGLDGGIGEAIEVFSPTSGRHTTDC
jgi:hypothetical protein